VKGIDVRSLMILAISAGEFPSSTTSTCRLGLVAFDFFQATILTCLFRDSIQRRHRAVRESLPWSLSVLPPRSGLSRCGPG